MKSHLPAPPVAACRPITTSLHGTQLTDDYAWLREKSSAEVVSYLEAENAYTGCRNVRYRTFAASSLR